MIGIKKLPNLDDVTLVRTPLMKANADSYLTSVVDKRSTEGFRKQKSTSPTYLLLFDDELPMRVCRFTQSHLIPCLIHRYMVPSSTLTHFYVITGSSPDSSRSYRMRVDLSFETMVFEQITVK